MSEKEYQSIISDKDTVISQKDSIISGKDAVISEKNALICSKETIISDQDREIASLKQQVDWLKKQMFGSKSEKLDPKQLGLGLDVVEETKVEPEKITVSYERQSGRKDQATKEESYEHLPIKKTVVVDPEEVKENPDAYELIDQRRTFEIGITAASLYRIQYIYKQYRLKQDRSQAPVVAPALARPVHGIASVSLLVHIVLNKYLDHLPLYRQEKILKRYGANISRQNMVNWVNSVANWLKPIYHYMSDDLVSGDYLQIDETPVRVIEPDMKLGKTRKAWLWPISRPGGDVVFTWSLKRDCSHVESILGDFQGYLQSDAYIVYEKFLKNRDKVIALACFAHVRRKFNDAKSEGSRPINILKIIAKLYAIESQLRECESCNADILQMRNQNSKPILEDLKQAIVETRKEVLPESKTGKACSYAINNWSALIRYIEDPRFQIDNNLIENAIRPSAIGKKNWLFIGHPKAGERSAIIYSIIISCQRHGIDPAEYLSDILAKVPSLVGKDKRHLTPANWKKS